MYGRKYPQETRTATAITYSPLAPDYTRNRQTEAVHCGTQCENNKIHRTIVMKTARRQHDKQHPQYIFMRNHNHIAENTPTATPHPHYYFAANLI